MASPQKLNLPESAYEGLRLLLTLSVDQANQLEQSLREAKPTLWPHYLANSVASALDGVIERKAVSKVIYTLSGFYIARTATNLPVSDFVDRVCEAMAESGNEALKPPDVDWSGFKDRLTRLLDIDQSLGVTAKAADVMTEHERPYHSARIMTDLRPVFKSDPRERPEAAIIIHTLKIVYQNRDREDLDHVYVALDSQDVRELKEVFARAEEKGEALASILEAARLTNLEPEGD